MLFLGILFLSEDVRLWSYGKLSQATILLQFVEEQLISRRFSAQHLSNLAWAAASLKGSVRRFAKAAQRCSSEMKPQELAGVIWALASAETSTSSTSLLSKFITEALQRDLKPQELCNVLWATAMLDLHEVALVRELAARLPEATYLDLTHFTPKKRTLKSEIGIR